MIHYTALALSISVNAVSLVLLKAYAVRDSRFIDWRLLLGVGLYGIAGVAWLIALSGVDLMVAYPALSLTYVFVALAGKRLFAETTSSSQWFAMMLIVAGVILMNTV